jgi:hypothetical protein
VRCRIAPISGSKIASAALVPSAARVETEWRIVENVERCKPARQANAVTGDHSAGNNERCKPFPMRRSENALEHSVWFDAQVDMREGRPPELLAEKTLLSDAKLVG